MALMVTRSPSWDPVIEEFLRQIAPIREQLERVILFGSRARGDSNPYSQ